MPEYSRLNRALACRGVVAPVGSIALMVGLCGVKGRLGGKSGEFISGVSGDVYCGMAPLLPWIKDITFSVLSRASLCHKLWIVLHQRYCSATVYTTPTKLAPKATSSSWISRSITRSSFENPAAVADIKKFCQTAETPTSWFGSAPAFEEENCHVPLYR